MRNDEMSHKWEEIHISARRKMGVDDVKIVAFDIFYRLVEVIVGLEIPLPGDFRFNE
jgi:hypothetical protein